MNRTGFLASALFTVVVACGSSSKTPSVAGDTLGDLKDVKEVASSDQKEGVAQDDGVLDEYSDQSVDNQQGQDPQPDICIDIFDPGADLREEDAQRDGSLDAPDVVCLPPSFSTNCAEVEEFQCGFQGECVDGHIEANWHHHWFCDGEEEITNFSCSYECPHGCKDLPPDDFYWPQNGKDMVEHYCAQCKEPFDCEGLEHPMCVGDWQCQKGTCVWVCSQGCVEEGGYVPVVPGAPECCDGLIKVPCDAPDAEGKCQLCAGASICTKCGDGVCGVGENKCNCPDDCKTCLDVGEGFIGFDSQDKCCEGLVAKSDCLLTYDGCSCPKCPCYVCLPCGDGVCGPFEHRCNCPEDCPDDFKCVQTYRSDCEGNPYGNDKKGELKLEVRGHDILFRHEKVVLNCCLETTVCFAPYWGSLEIIEKKVGDTPCFCECLFTIEAKLEGIKSGDYNYAVYNEEQGATLFQGTLTIQ